MKVTSILTILMAIFSSFILSKSYLVEVDDRLDYRRRKVGLGRRKMGGDYSDDDIYGTLGR